MSELALFPVEAECDGWPLKYRVLRALSSGGRRVSQMLEHPALLDETSPRLTAELKRLKADGLVDLKPRTAFMGRSSWPRTWRITSLGTARLAGFESSLSGEKQ